MTSRFDAGLLGLFAGVGGGQVQVGRVVRIVVRQGRLGQQQVGAAGELDQRVVRAGVAGVDERFAAVLNPDRVRRHRVHHRRGPDGEGPDLLNILPGMEFQLLLHPGIERQVVGQRHPVRRTGRAEDGDPRDRCARRVLGRDVQTAQVHAVVRMQVGQADRADLRNGEMPLERAERATAEVEDQVEPLGGDQIARGGRVRPGDGPGATDHGELHSLNITGGLPRSQESRWRRLPCLAVISGIADPVPWKLPARSHPIGDLGASGSRRTGRRRTAPGRGSGSRSRRTRPGCRW